jgi:hypothetical protein
VFMETNNTSNNGALNPHGVIDWKGITTEIEIYCKCRKRSWVDVRSEDPLQCKHCGTIYALDTRIELFELKRR